jgi:hypothetical protein
MTQPWSDLERLGQVTPPPPAVLDAAREILWAAVATEMLDTHGPGESGQITQREADRQQRAPRRLPPDPGA